MNEEQNMPDELWRRAFDEAAETPPPRVWNAIERQLDEPEGGRVVPLWANGLSRPLIWGMGVAAAVSLLLVGVWLVRLQPAEQTAVTQQHPTETDQSLATVRPDHTAGRNGAEKAVALSAPSTPLPNAAAPDKPENMTAAMAVADANADRLAQQQAERINPAKQEIAVLMPNTLLRNTSMELITRSGMALLTNSVSGRLAPESDKPILVEPDQLASLGVRLYEMRPLQRIVWFAPVVDESIQLANEQVRVAGKTKWASVNVMPGVFNPGVSVALPAYTNSVANTVSPPVVSSRASVAVSVQASAGVQLSERWSVESGVGYLVGRSTVESPGAQPVYNFAQSGVAANTTPAAVGNLYTDLLRSQVSAATGNRNNVASNDFISNTNQYVNLSGSRYGNRQTVSNDYAYVQVPVQVGYELRPRKRLTLAVLGGLITNIFVRNTVDDALVVKTGNGVYEPVALVASMGARFRYRSSERWSASVAGVYQPAITPGTRPDSPVQNQPTTSGVTVGVDYHF